MAALRNPDEHRPPRRSNPFPGPPAPVRAIATACNGRLAHCSNLLVTNLVTTSTPNPPRNAFEGPTVLCFFSFSSNASDASHSIRSHTTRTSSHNHHRSPSLSLPSQRSLSPEPSVLRSLSLSPQWLTSRSRSLFSPHSLASSLSFLRSLSPSSTPVPIRPAASRAGTRSCRLRSRRSPLRGRTRRAWPLGAMTPP